MTSVPFKTLLGVPRPQLNWSSISVIFPVAVDFLIRWEAEGAEQRSSQRGPGAHEYEDEENRKVCIPVLAVRPNSSPAVSVAHWSFYRSLSSSSCVPLCFTALSSSPTSRPALSSPSQPQHVIHGKDYCVVSQGGRDDVNLKTSLYMCVNQHNEIRVTRTRQLLSLLLLLLSFNPPCWPYVWILTQRVTGFFRVFPLMSVIRSDKDYSLYIRVLTINQWQHHQ